MTSRSTRTGPIGYCPSGARDEHRKSHKEGAQLTMPEPVDAYDVLGRHWPHDGPYGDHTTEQAATAIERLVRCLNNATGTPDALHYAPTMRRTIRSLAPATHGLDQLLRQLAVFSADLVNDLTLYDDRHNGDWPAAKTASELSMALHAARDYLVHVTGHLNDAHLLASYLGHYSPDEPHQ